LRLTPDGLYVAATLAILVVWPYPEEARRFLWVLLPVLFGQSLLAVRAALQGNIRSALLAKLAFAAAILIMVLPVLAFFVQRYHAAAESGRPEAAHNTLWYVPNPADAERWVGMQAAMIATLQQGAGLVPASDCILASRPDIVNYFAHRMSTYPPPPSTPDVRFEQELRSIGCHYLFSIIATDPNRRLAPLYPLNRIPGGFTARLACAAPDDHYTDPNPVCLLTELSDASPGRP
jgi:hypothetical protein